MLWILDYRRTTRTATRIAVAGTVRVDEDCAWVEGHVAVNYMPGLTAEQVSHFGGSLTKPCEPDVRWENDRKNPNETGGGNEGF